MLVVSYRDRERKHPTEKWLDDAERRLHTPPPKEKRRARKGAETDVSATEKALAAAEKEVKKLKQALNKG